MSEPASNDHKPTLTLTPDDIREVLRDVVDPEMHINIVDLGLIYDVVIDSPEKVSVKMTLTSPGCPYGPYLFYKVRALLEAMPRVKEVDLEIVWDPPWGAEHMSEEARLELGLDI